mmetsp:Transcript_39675/g.131310  ORF Transcript_39675/g.131310 Transcript_39675/m.131310 type:complete len:290 (+) Transcript_39675:1183-2052(+)
MQAVSIGREQAARPVASANAHILVHVATPSRRLDDPHRGCAVDVEGLQRHTFAATHAERVWVANGRDGDEVADTYGGGVGRDFTSAPQLDAPAPTFVPERRGALPEEINRVLAEVAAHGAGARVPKGDLGGSRLGEDLLPLTRHGEARVKDSLHLAARGQIAHSSHSALCVEWRVVVNHKGRGGVAPAPAKVPAVKETETASSTEPKGHAGRHHRKVDQAVDVDERVAEVVVAPRNGEGASAPARSFRQRCNERWQWCPRRRCRAEKQQQQQQQSRGRPSHAAPCRLAR